MLNKNVENVVYESISTILNNKFIDINSITNKNKLSFLNFSHSCANNDDFIINYLKKKSNIKNIQYYSINMTESSNSIYKTKNKSNENMYSLYEY